MSSLFDLPVRRRAAGLASARPPASSRTQPVHRHGADRGHPRRARNGLRRCLRRRRADELPALAHGPHLLHAEGRRRADQGRDVPLGRPLPEVQARGRPARHRARPRQRVRRQGRVSDHLRVARAARPRRPAARVRAIAHAPGRGRPVRPVAQAAAAAASPPHRRRHLARRRGHPRHPDGARRAAIPTRRSSSVRRACRARAPRPTSRAASRPSRASTMWTW